MAQDFDPTLDVDTGNAPVADFDPTKDVTPIASATRVAGGAVAVAPVAAPAPPVPQAAPDFDPTAEVTPAITPPRLENAPPEGMVAGAYRRLRESLSPFLGKTKLQEQESMGDRDAVANILGVKAADLPEESDLDKEGLVNGMFSKPIGPPIPKIKTDGTSTLASIAAGAANAGSGLLDSLRSPGGLMTGGIGGEIAALAKAPEVASGLGGALEASRAAPLAKGAAKAATGTFAAGMGADALTDTPQLAQTLNDPKATTQQKTEAALGTATKALLGGLGAHEAFDPAKPVEPAAANTAPEVTPEINPKTLQLPHSEPVGPPETPAAEPVVASSQQASFDPTAEVTPVSSVPLDAEIVDDGGATVKAKQAVQYPANYKAPVPLDQSLGSTKDALAYRQERMDNYKQVLQDQIGLSSDQADRLISIHAREGDDTRFQKSLTPEQSQKMENFFDGPLNQTGGPLDSWIDDSSKDPTEIAESKDPVELAKAAVDSLGNLNAPPEFGATDRFLHPVVALNRLREIGGGWSDVSDALERKLGRMRAGDDTPELYAAYGKQIKGFADKYGISLPLEKGGPFSLPAAPAAALEAPAEPSVSQPGEPEPQTAPSAAVPPPPTPPAAPPAAAAPDDPLNNPTPIQTRAAQAPTPANRATAIQANILGKPPAPVKTFLAQMAGHAAPVTSTLAPESGNALVRYASAAIAAPELAKTYAADVLGSHIHDPAFADRLGSTLVEDRLRGVKAGILAAAQAATDPQAKADLLAQAQQVGSLVGQKGSQFATEADFKAALADPEIQAAIGRHKEMLEPFTEQMHSDLGGRKATPGPNTGAFVNLEAILQDENGNPVNQDGKPIQGASRGNLTNPLKRGSRFNQQALGTGTNYVTDYNAIARRMVSGNFEETAKRQLYDQLHSDGLAVELPPGQKPPQIGGDRPVQFNVERRGQPGPNGTTMTKVTNLWVDKRIASEVRQALNTDGPVSGAGARMVANAINRIQLAGPTDAVYHVANIMSRIAGTQGGKNVMIDLARKLPGVNVLDAVSRIALRAKQVVADDAPVRRQIASLARIGATRAESDKAGPMGKMIELIDRSARLVSADMHQNLVDRGLAADTESGRREFVNRVGNYNARLASWTARAAKEWGISPFITAGRTFNRLGREAMSTSPKVQTAGLGAELRMRAVEAAGLAASLTAIPMTINHLISGSPTGYPGTPVGAISWKDKNGKLITVDPLQWTGARRGMRITGVNAAVNGILNRQEPGKIMDNAAHDVWGGIIHPWAGPVVNAASTLVTGKNAGQFQQAPTAKMGQSQAVLNAKAVPEQFNPLVASTIQGLGKDWDWKKAAQSTGFQLTGAFGVQQKNPIAAGQTISSLAQQYEHTHGIDRETPPGPGKYTGLVRAIEDGDHDAAALELQELQKTDKPAQIQQYFRRYPYQDFTAKKSTEYQFKQSLSPDDQKLYDQARADRLQTAQAVRELIQTQRGAGR